MADFDDDPRITDEPLEDMWGGLDKDHDDAPALPFLSLMKKAVFAFINVVVAHLLTCGVGGEAIASGDEGQQLITQTCEYLFMFPSACFLRVWEREIERESEI